MTKNPKKWLFWPKFFVVSRRSRFGRYAPEQLFLLFSRFCHTLENNEFKVFRICGKIGPTFEDRARFSEGKIDTYGKSGVLWELFLWY